MSLSYGEFPKDSIENGSYQFHLPIVEPYQLGMFVRTAFGVRIPDKKVCPGHSTPWEAFCAAFFAKDPVLVVKASRGFGGKSFWMALLALTEGLLLKADVNVLGGSGEQSRRVLENMQDLWAKPGAPRHLGVAEIQREMRFKNGARIRALMASQASVRGPHPQRLRLDEIDEMDIKILDASLGQPMTRRGIESQTVMASTHQNHPGTMSDILQRALDQEWPVHTWCYRETMEPHGWLDKVDIERKRNEVSARMFANEYDLQAPSPESRAIEPEACEVMFNPAFGTYLGSNREALEFEDPENGASYSTGVDWGRKVDHTVITTYRTDVTPMRLVAWEQLKGGSWPEHFARVEERLKRYPGSALHDGTGIGDMADHMLNADIEPLLMVGKARHDLLHEYTAAIERLEMTGPRVDYAYKEHLYCDADDLVKGGGHPPDSIVAGALAYRAATIYDSSIVGVPVEGGTHKPLRID